MAWTEWTGTTKLLYTARPNRKGKRGWSCSILCPFLIFHSGGARLFKRSRYFNNIIIIKSAILHNNYVQNLITPNTKTISKHLWSFIKNKKCDHTGVGPLIHGGTTYTDPQDKANLMADYFSSVFTSENTDGIPSLNKDPLPDIPVGSVERYHEVHSQVLKLVPKTITCCNK